MRSIALACLLTATLPAAEPLVPLSNHQSGISVSLSGTNGVDWALEQTCHDPLLADLVFHVKSTVAFTLAHNENNTLVHEGAKERRLGDAADAGVIHLKIDHDQQLHPYTGQTPPWAAAYAGPFAFATATYDGSRKVLGQTGDNGGAWGQTPRNNDQRGYYGLTDAAGNEWHSLTWWDDDLAALAKRGIDAHRQGASDGHCIAICVDPRTPIIQFAADTGGQFLTSPAKTYHIPRIWERTTWLTDHVRLHLINLTDAQPVQFRIDDQPWRPYAGDPIDAASLFAGDDRRHVLEARCGEQGTVVRRQIIYRPAPPAAPERHGRLLWSDAEDRERVTAKLAQVAPFKQAFASLRANVRKLGPASHTALRGGWRSGAGSASSSLDAAFVAAIDGFAERTNEASDAKLRLLRLARLQPVGCEADINSHSPGKDFLNELGQTLQQYTDAAVAYDLLADGFRSGQQPGGMTPIEEIIIREGLAKIAHAILGRMRDSYGTTIGGGDTHWAHAYDITIGTIALAMPTYATPWYGVSGADNATRNDRPAADGLYWNPFPDQGVTWWQAVTDPLVPTPGHPNLRQPFRAEFLLTDDGWWTGPNDFVGDGDRFCHRRLVDVQHGGLAHAECRIELTELHGYETPFTTRYGAWLAMRRLVGDPRPLPPSGLAYVRRRLVHGAMPMRWDTATKVYLPTEASVLTALTSCNRHFDFAGLPASRTRVQALLARLSEKNADLRPLTDPYILALCDVPESLPAAQDPPLPKPVIRPLMKHQGPGSLGTVADTRA